MFGPMMVALARQWGLGNRILPNDERRGDLYHSAQQQGQGDGWGIGNRVLPEDKRHDLAVAVTTDSVPRGVWHQSAVWQEGTGAWAAAASAHDPRPGATPPCVAGARFRATHQIVERHRPQPATAVCPCTQHTLVSS